jgi:hypothetical protein
MCVPPVLRCDRGGTSTRCADLRDRPPQPALAEAHVWAAGGNQLNGESKAIN